MKNILLLIFCVTVTYAKPLGMALEEVRSNASLIFRYRNVSIECAPYGVFTLIQVYNKKDLSAGCKRMIKSFFLSHPKIRYFADYKLHFLQYYMVEPKGNGQCLVNVRGKRSFSQLLLLNGAAALRKNFKDEELRNTFFKAQKSARIIKKGIWSEPRLKKCLLEFMQ